MLYELLMAVAPTPQDGRAGVIPVSSVLPTCSGVEALAQNRPAPSLVWITNLQTVASMGRDELPGRRLATRDIRVQAVADRGFWITAGDTCRMFVVPAEGDLIHVRTGDLVDLQGEFRRVPAAVDDGLGSVYLYAYIVRGAPASP